MGGHRVGVPSRDLHAHPHNRSARRSGAHLELRLVIAAPIAIQRIIRCSREPIYHGEASGGGGLHLLQDFFYCGLGLRKTSIKSVALRPAGFPCTKDRDCQPQSMPEKSTESGPATLHGCSNSSRGIHPCCPSWVSTPYQ